MMNVNKVGIVLQKTNLGFENEGVLNPAIIENEQGLHMFYRAVSKGNYSSIGYCKLKNENTIEFRRDSPLLFSQFEYESHGLEDPRIVKIEDTYYLTYTAYDGINALGALAISKDLITFEKKGIIAPMITYAEFGRLAASKGKINEKYQRFNDHAAVATIGVGNHYVWDKNIVFFPEKINGKLAFIHRVRPDIQIAFIDDLADLTMEFWQNYFLQLDDHILLSSKYKHEVSYIGGGCPPIKTEFGWLLIYHGVHDTINGYVYSACAALLDLQNPQIEIGRLRCPLFKPEISWELKGEVNNVCFPTGSIVRDDTLYIYYGAADEQIAVASVCLSDLLNHILNPPKNKITQC